MFATKMFSAAIAIAAVLSINTFAGERLNNPLDANYYWAKSNPTVTAVQPTEASATQTFGTHHVYSCHQTDRYWIDTVVPNQNNGPASDVVEPSFRALCPFGNPIGGYQGTAATSSKPYDDSSNPLHPAHKFH
jgi:hypothetical protein